MSELLNIYKTLKNKKWVSLSHKIDEKGDFRLYNPLI